MNSWKRALLVLPLMLIASSMAFAQEDDEDQVHWYDYLGFRARFLYDDYTDLNITHRDFVQNDLGLFFIQPTLGEQNDVEQVRWREKTELFELVGKFDLGSADIRVFLGYGGSQVDTRFNNNNILISAGVSEIGASLKFKPSDKWEGGFEVSLMNAVSDKLNLNEISDSPELISMQWRRVSFAASVGRVYKYQEVTLTPRIGILYATESIDVDYKVVYVTGKSILDMDMENDGATNLRLTFGTELKWEGHYPAIDLGVSIGADQTYGFYFSAVQFF